MHRRTRSRHKKQFWLLGLKSEQQILKLLLMDFSDIFKQPAATVLLYFPHSPHHCFPLISWWWWLVVVWEEREKMKRWTGCTCRDWNWWYCLSLSLSHGGTKLQTLVSVLSFLSTSCSSWAKKSNILGKIGSISSLCAGFNLFVEL